MKLLLATGNSGKIAEIRQILGQKPVKLITMAASGLFPHPEENGQTFEENALIKAREFCKASGVAALADDSGLCVDALHGEPGVRSARYGGEGASDQDNLRLLLKNLEGVEEARRTACFCCVCAVVFPDGREITAEGFCPGVITTAPEGEGGFGYDPVFFVPSAGQTFAGMPEELKNQISHRAEALRRLSQKLWPDEKN